MLNLKIAQRSLLKIPKFNGLRFITSSLRQNEKEVILSQSSNRELTWSKNQAKRSERMVGPRFEQTDLAAQPKPPAAIELIYEEPIREVETRIASCNGGDGPLGHPKVYINLDQGKPTPCGYCGIRYQLKPHHH